MRITTRSPMGPGAAKISAADPGGLARSLERESWVSAVAVRPRHLYLEIETEHLLCWLGDSYSERLLRQAESLARVPSDAGRGEEEHLAGHRADLVSAALLRITGKGDDAETGEVDVRYGPLRMKSGGEVHPSDVKMEIERRLQGAPVSPACALALSLLEFPRKKHAQVSEGWVKESVESCQRLTKALTPANSGVSATPTDGRLRALALELDRLQLSWSFAVERRDPVYLVRSLSALVNRTIEVPCARVDPIGASANRAIRLCLEALWGSSAPV